MKGLCNATVVEPIVIPPDHSDQPSSRQPRTSSQQIIDITSDETHPLIKWIRKFLLLRIRHLFPLVLLVGCLLASSVAYHYNESIRIRTAQQSVLVSHVSDDFMTKDRALLRICKGNTADEKETVLGVLWDDDCHIITRYSDLKGSSVFTVEKAEAVHVPLSIQALDEDSDIAILKLDQSNAQWLKAVIDKRQEGLNAQMATAVDNPDAAPPKSDTASLDPTAAVSASQEALSETMRSVSRRDIDHLILYGRRVN